MDRKFAPLHKQNGRGGKTPHVLEVGCVANRQLHRRFKDGVVEKTNPVLVSILEYLTDKPAVRGMSLYWMGHEGSGTLRILKKKNYTLNKYINFHRNRVLCTNNINGTHQHTCAVGWGTALQARNSGGAIPDGVFESFHWLNPLGYTMTLGSTHPLNRN